MKRSYCLHNCGCCKLLLIINSSEPLASNGNEEDGKTKKSAFVCTAALTDLRQSSLVRQISESGVTSLKQQWGKQTQIGICFLIPASRSTSHWAEKDSALVHRTKHPQSKNREYQQERRRGRFRGGATTSQGQRPAPQRGVLLQNQQDARPASLTPRPTVRVWSGSPGGQEGSWGKAEGNRNQGRSDSECMDEGPQRAQHGYREARGFPGGSGVKNPLAVQEMQEMRVRSLGREDPLEEDMATHSSVLAWRIPWSEEPRGLQSVGLQSRTRLRAEREPLVTQKAAAGNRPQRTEYRDSDKNLFTKGLSSPIHNS